MHRYEQYRTIGRIILRRDDFTRLSPPLLVEICVIIGAVENREMRNKKWAKEVL